MYIAILHDYGVDLICRKSDTQGEVITLDLHDHRPKEALSLLKLHLRSLANIPCKKSHSHEFYLCFLISFLFKGQAWLDNYMSFCFIVAFRHLKVIMDTDAEDITKGKRKRMVRIL